MEMAVIGRYALKGLTALSANRNDIFHDKERALIAFENVNI